jgi:hypothetical protein
MAEEVGGEASVFDDAAIGRIAGAMMAEPGTPPEPVTILSTMTDEAWDRMLKVHLYGTFYVSRAALRHMERARSGAIVNLGSIYGLTGSVLHPNYAVAKGGITQLTRSSPIHRRSGRPDAGAPTRHRPVRVSATVRCGPSAAAGPVPENQSLEAATMVEFYGGETAYRRRIRHLARVVIAATPSRQPIFLPSSRLRAS